MTDLKPLRESSTDGFARGLLESAFLDEPPRRSLRKTAAFLGMSEAAATTLVASSATGAAPGALGTAAGALSASAAGGKAALLVALKWLGAGAIVGAATAGGIDYLSDAPPTHPAVAPASVAVPSTAGQHVEPASEPIRPATAPTAVTADPETARPRAGVARDLGVKTRIADTSPLAAAKPGSVDTPALDGEIRRLDRARAALAQGSSEAALAELAAYENERKTAVLEREANVLRIDAMLARGDREEARTLARRYVAAHPDDPHARRLRQLLESEGER